MSVRPGLGRGFRRLGIAVCVLVGVVGLLDALLLQVGMSTVEAFYDTATDDATYQRQLVSLDQWSVGTMVVYALVFLAAGVCWIDWQGQLASSPRLERAGGRLRPGWHAWAWFVPVLNLVLPALAMRQLDRGLGVPGRRRLRSPLWMWWISFVLSVVLGRYAAWRAYAVEDLVGAGDLDRAIDLYERCLVLGVIGNALGVVAAVLAIGIVHDLTTRALEPVRDDLAPAAAR